MIGHSAVRPLQSVSVAVTSSGNTQVVASSPGKSIRVTSFCLTLTNSGGSGVTVEFRSGPTTPVWSCVVMASNEMRGVAMTTAVPGWLFSTAPGEALNINLSAPVPSPGIQCSLTYWLD